MEERKVRRKGGELTLCRCPTCGAWHVRARVPSVACGRTRKE